MARTLDESRARATLEDWRRSGLSAAKYAKRAGVSGTTLTRWRARFGDSEVSSPRFARVVLRESPKAVARDECEYVIEVGNGRRIRVGAGFDADELGRLLAVVEGAGC